MNFFKRFSKRQIGLLAGLLLLFIVTLGSTIGFLLFDFYGHPATASTATYALTPSGTRPPSTSTLLQTVVSTSPIPSSTPNSTATLSAAAPTPTATLSAAAPTPTTTIYIVQEKDTLWDIALQFGITVEAIQQANGLSNDIIHPGQQLIIPSGAVPTQAVAGNVYIVAPQDTVDSIAAQYGLSADDLRAANYMSGDALLPGQQIVIPETTPVAVRPYQFSINQGDLASAYPLSLNPGRFSMHYTPNTFPAQDPQSVYELVQRSVDHIESQYQIQLPGTFDVYVAGSVFEHPQSQLRGISFSVYHRTFFIHDGAGSAVDQQYISSHELTHLFLWNTFGQPASTMLSEGAAVYSGMTLIAGSDYLSLTTFCAAYWQAGSLPRVSSQLSFTGHIYDLENYYASGCFVGYLIESYGVQPFGQVYHGGNFTAVYGKTLPALEQEWIVSLQSMQLPLDLAPTRLIESVRVLEASYRNLMPTFGGTTYQLHAYYHLDQARLALLKGHFDEMQAHLVEYQSALAGP